MSWNITMRTGAPAQSKQRADVQTEFTRRPSMDAVSLEVDGVLVILEGIVLNSQSLMAKTGKPSLGEAVIDLYKTAGRACIVELQGSFCGAFYEHSRASLLGFTNKTGDRALFYASEGDAVHLSSDFEWISETLRAAGTLHPNPLAARYLLTYGFMLDNATHVEGIEKLGPGEIVDVSSGRPEVSTYHRFGSNDQLDISFDDAVFELDRIFRASVARLLAKDAEFGKPSVLADMSGGLDTRIVSWVAKELGVPSITNICYAQSQATEGYFAAKVARELGNDLLFMPLDSHNFLYDIDRISGMNHGLAIYSGITGGERLLRYLSSAEFGIEMTGQLGGIIVGSYVGPDDMDSPPRFGFGKYSDRLSSNFEASILEKYSNLEMMAIYTRGFRGTLSTHMVRQHYFEVGSPFLDEEMVEFCLSLPLRYRVDHRLYIAWLLKMYPDAARIPSTRSGGPVASSRLRTFLSKSKDRGLDAMLRKVGRATGKSFQRKSSSMNPFDHWYRSSGELRAYFASYYQAEAWRLEGNPQLEQAAREMFQNGDAMERMQVLTVLSMYRRLDVSFA